MTGVVERLAECLEVLVLEQGREFGQFGIVGLFLGSLIVALGFRRGRSRRLGRARCDRFDGWFVPFFAMRLRPWPDFDRRHVSHAQDRKSVV